MVTLLHCKANLVYLCSCQSITVKTKGLHSRIQEDSFKVIRQDIIFWVENPRCVMKDTLTSFLTCVCVWGGGWRQYSP